MSTKQKAVCMSHWHDASGGYYRSWGEVTGGLPNGHIITSFIKNI